LKKWLVLLLAIVAAVIGWGFLRQNAPLKATFVQVKRQKLVSTLPTNGKAEPIEWEPVRAETSGLVTKVAAQEGQTVSKGALLAEMRDPTLAADIEAAQAKVEESRANLAALEAGGRPADLAEIDGNLARDRFDLQKAQNDLAVLRRLEQKSAATPFDVQTAADKVRQLEIDIAGLEKRRTSLVARPEVDAAKARLQDAETALELARQRAAQSVIRAPMAGEVYGLAVRQGTYLNTGDLVANIGRLDRLRVRVYVDEPLLGRVAEGEPVTIRWEALPGKEWKGTVVSMPTSIQSLGSRQVGEVMCIIENPGRDLIPGTNVDAEIRTAVMDNALVIPKEALHHDAAGDYVLLRQGETVQRRAVKTGNSTVTLIQITEGLAEGDEVAMPGSDNLKPGARVEASK
jgi:HlyD family secretion protein